MGGIKPDLAEMQVRRAADHEGARLKGTDANRLNFAFLGQRIALIGHKRLRAIPAFAGSSRHH
jgi:hypothetical protein